MIRAAKVLLLLATSALTLPTTAATSFLVNTQLSGLNGMHSGVVTGADLVVTFTAGHKSAIIVATDAGRVGVDSHAVPGVVDPFPNKLNLMGGSAAGQGESLSFSFDRPGILDKLFFDGVKDETLEFFTLRLPNGNELTIFDFEAEFRLNYQGFAPIDLAVPSFTMTDDASDDISGLGIRFRAGEVFTLTYGQIDYAALLPGYVPMNSEGIPTGGIANGARFEGLSVSLIPEPSSLLIAMSGVSGLLQGRRTRRVLWRLFQR